MKLLVHAGPDTLAVKYKSKAACKAALRKAITSKKAKKAKSKTDICLTWQGRRFSIVELSEAVILTKEEYWQAMRP